MLIPVFFLLAFAVGEATLAILGHPSGGDVPTWASLIADVTTLAVFLAPCVAAVAFGRRAERAGLHGAAVPVVIAVVAGAAVIILTIITELGNAL